MNEEKNENLIEQEKSNINPYINTQQFIFKKEKLFGGAADITAMIITYFLTAELMSSLFLSNDFVFTWKTTVIYFLFFITATVYILSKNKDFSLSAIPSGIAALILSVTFAFHQNSGLNVIIFLAIIVLSGIYCTRLTKSGNHKSSSYFSVIDILNCELIIPLTHIFAPLPAAIRGIKRNRLEKSNSDIESKKADAEKWLISALGIIFAIPLLLIVLPLLVKSDIAFESFAGSLTDTVSKFFSAVYEKYFEYLDFEGAFAYFASLFITPYILSVMFCFRHGVNRKENKDTSERFLRFRKMPQNFFVAFLLVFSIVYAIFLLSQTAYFFSAFTGHLPFGAEITVTQYARKGFFEMMEIAMINFCLIALTVIFSKRRDGRITGLVKALNIFLCVFTIIISLASVAKILLYISSFGLTPKRVYVFVFDIILIITFVCIILRFFIEKFPYMKVITSAVCVALIIMGLFGTDKFIADKNADLYLSGKLDDIDVEELCYLSPSSVPALEKIGNSDTKKAAAARSKLSLIASYNHIFESLIDHPLRSDSLEQYKAAKIINRSNNNLKELERENIAFVYLEDGCKNIDSISVSTKKESLTVQNADSTSLEDDELYRFEIDTKSIKKYVFTIKSGDETYSVESETNFAIFYYDEYFHKFMNRDHLENYHNKFNESDVWNYLLPGYDYDR